MSGSTQETLLDVEALRADFPILAQTVRNRVPLVYLDNAATTQRPRQIIQTIVETYERHYANVHRGIHWLADRSDDLYENARENVRKFIGAARPEEIIFTGGTTDSINLVARSFGEANIGPDDEILLTEMEHHSNLVPWLQLAQRTGATIRYIPLRDDGLLELDALDRLLTKRTKLVGVAAVSNVLGTVNPIREIVCRAHDIGAVVLVDAAQSVPHHPTDVTTLGVDFLAFSGHKMLGPSGCGVLYGRYDLLDAMPPFLGGGSMIRRVKLEGFEPAELPQKFEAGTPPIVPAIGLGAAVDYLRQVGLEAIERHELRLTEYAHHLLEGIEGVRILGPNPRQKGGIVSFTLDRIHAHDVAQVLDRHGVAVRAGHHCAMPLHKRYGISATTRASFYFYNTLEEVDKLAEGIEQVKRVFRRGKPRTRRR